MDTNGMEWLEQPSTELWKARRHWFDELSESLAGEKDPTLLVNKLVLL